MSNLSNLLSRPRVVATVHRLEDLESITSGSLTPELCDILEFRLDSLRDHLGEVDRAMKASPYPTLITARHPAEGGEGNLDTPDRLALLSRFLPQATLVDGELRSLVDYESMLKEARRQEVGIILSAHNFERAFEEEPFKNLVTAAREQGAIAKAAMILSTPQELATLLSRVSEGVTEGTRIAAMGMGPLGKVSRLALAAAGSCLNYGYLSEPNAPGQWSAKELKRLLGEILPAD